MQTVKLNDIGKEVLKLKELLQKQGAGIEVNETFDAATKAAVIAYQKAHGVDADGIVGYRTWEALLLSGVSAGERLTYEDFELVASLLDVEVAALKAVQEVESGGKGGFFAPGKPAILFEGHIFWNQLKRRGINPENYCKGNEHILYPRWEKGHYKGGLAEYDRLEQARKINYEAADASAHWGMFQIMGFNYAACGENSVAGLVNKMMQNELGQLILIGRFIRQSMGLHIALQNRDWAAFAKCYNGPRYAEDKYDVKLATAYKKHQQ